MPAAPGEAPTSRFTRRTETVREAFRLGRLAKTQRRLWQFYVEHNLHEEARVTRVLMLEFLRSASQQWRLTLAGNN